MARRDESSSNPFLMFPDHEYSGIKSCAAAQDELPSLDFACTSSATGLQQDEQHEQPQGPHESAEMEYSWTKAMLLDCARAVAEDDTPRIQSLLWNLNENASPYGDADQRIASCFVQALFCRVTGTGDRCLLSLGAAAEKTFCFESVRSMILEFQEASPWTTFGHVAGNGALLEAMEGESRIHIVDISSTFCTQWPTFLEALATRTGSDVETPHVRLTAVVVAKEEAALAVMQQVTRRLHRFARLMGVPFQSHVLQQPLLAELDLARLDLRDDEALAINCVQTMHLVPDLVADLAWNQEMDEDGGGDESGSRSSSPRMQRCPLGMSPRDRLLSTFRSANPKMLLMVEDEANLVWPADNDFVGCFGEALRFYALFLESLEDSFPRASPARLTLERTCARQLLELLSCDPQRSLQQRENGNRWDQRLRQAGFLPAPFSNDVVDDVHALLKRYKQGWGVDNVDTRLSLTWKEQAVICSSAWKLITTPSH